MNIRVMLADDHAVVREGYKRLLERTRDIEVTIEAGSGEEAYRQFCAGEPDVGVMDINLPGISGIEATRRITADRPDVRVVLVSTYAADDLPADAADCGATAYVRKEDLTPRRLRDALAD
jgi:DNA-binding NarL/FixJ family response regulator